MEWTNPAHIKGMWPVLENTAVDFRIHKNQLISLLNERLIGYEDLANEG